MGSGMIKVFKRLAQKSNHVFVFHVVPILFLLLWLSVRPVITYADENNSTGMEETPPSDGNEQTYNN